MFSFVVESNGRIEKTAVYYNGEQLGGVKEVFFHISEEGDFDAIIHYRGVDNQDYSRTIFEGTLPAIKVVEPTFTEEEAMQLRSIEIQSNGQLEDTIVYLDEEEQFGIVSVLIHIKSPTTEQKSGITGIFSKKKVLSGSAECMAEITYRNDDDTIETERIF